MDTHVLWLKKSPWLPCSEETEEGVTWGRKQVGQWEFGRDNPARETGPTGFARRPALGYEKKEASRKLQDFCPEWRKKSYHERNWETLWEEELERKKQELSVDHSRLEMPVTHLLETAKQTESQAQEEVCKTSFSKMNMSQITKLQKQSSLEHKFVLLVTGRGGGECSHCISRKLCGRPRLCFKNTTSTYPGRITSNNKLFSNKVGKILFSTVLLYLCPKIIFSSTNSATDCCVSMKICLFY